MYTPRHARPSCLPVRAAVTGSLTAVLLPLTMAAPALAVDLPVEASGTTTGTSVSTTVLPDSTTPDLPAAAPPNE